MIEKDKIKWIKQDDGRTQAHYKGVKLDLSPETIQDIYHGSITEEDLEKIFLNSYERCLRVHREQLLKQLLDDKNRK